MEIHLLFTAKISLYLLLWFLHLVVYYDYISLEFGHMGFHWAFSKDRIIESSIILLILSAYLPSKITKPSDILIHIHLVFPITGMLTYYAAGNGESWFLYITIICFLVMLITMKYSQINFPSLRVIRSIHIERLSFLIGILYILSIIFFTGFSYFNLDLLRVYEFRSDAANALPIAYGYISPMVSKVILPFSFLLALVNRNRSIALLTALLCVLTFAFTAHKGPLFYPLLVAGLYYLLGFKHGVLLFIAMNCLILAIPYSNLLNEGDIAFFNNLLIRRVYYVPGLLNFLYYDFFSAPQNSFAIWTESKVSLGLLDLRYTDAIPNIIGTDYFNNPDMWANTGWIGSGYMQLGFIGMLIYSVIMGLLLNLLNSFGRELDLRFVSASSIVPMFSIMVSSDLPGAFLTHGIILSIFMFSVLRSDISIK